MVQGHQNLQLLGLLHWSWYTPLIGCIALIESPAGDFIECFNSFPGNISMPAGQISSNAGLLMPFCCHFK